MPEERHPKTFIRRVIICGFRSYREEVIIDSFSPRLNVIVGANGAGKSNFFNAIEFVLNAPFRETSNDERRSLLYEGCGPRVLNASVVIVFDNTDGMFPLNTEEVSLKRTVGTKKDQFFINNKAVNKQEVTSFLETAGLTKGNPYYIVKQGKINQLSLCKDEDRLKLLKSIAGATSFESSLDASQKGLNRTDATLTEIEQRILDIKERMTDLNVESTELQEFLETDKTKRLLERAICMKELETVKSKLSEMLNAAPLNENLLTRQKELKILRDKIKNLKTKVMNEENESRQCSNQIEIFRKHLEKLEQEVVRLEMELEDLYTQRDGTQLEEFRNGLDELNGLIQERQDRLRDLRQQYKDNDKAKHDCLKTMDLKKQRRSELARYGNFTNREERDAWINSVLLLVREQLAAKERRITEHRKEIEDFERQKKKLEQQINSNVESKNGEQIDLRCTTAQLKELHKSLQDDKDKRMDLWREIDLLEHDVEILKKEDAKKRRAVICSMGKSMFDGIVSVENILTEFSQRTDDAAMHVNEGYMGMVVQTFNCGENLYTAVDVTAGRRLFYHIVTTPRVATLILREMNRHNLPGEAHFIVLDKIYPYREELPRIRREICTDRLDAAHLLSHLEYQKYDAANNVVQERALQSIWYNTFICASMDGGSQLANLNEDLQFVTMEGDIVRKGALTGGYCDPRWSKIRNHREFCAVQDRLHATQNQLDAKKEKKHGLDVSIAAMEGRQSINKINAIKYTNDIKDRERKLEYWGAEYAKLEKIRRCKELSLMSLRADVERLNQREASLQAELAQEMVSQLTDEEAAEMIALDAEIKDLRKKERDHHKNQSMLNREMNEIENLIEQSLILRRKEIEKKICELTNMDWQNKIDSLKADLQRRTTKIADIKRAIRELTEKKNQADKDVEENKGKIEKLLSDCASKEAEIFRISDAYHKSIAQKSTLEEKESFLNDKLSKLGPVPNLRRLNDILGTMNLEQMCRRLRDCSQRLHAFDHINQKAIQQFQEMQIKQEQLEARYAEIERGRELIIGMMENLQHRKNETINLTFKQVSENFRTVFRYLVPNGRASLELIRRDSQSSNPNATPNMDSSSGFAIRVSFNAGGAEMVDLAQLSGGQKTCVSFALILALQACAPAPFYLFDEIDQALDVIYRERVAALIQNRSHRSQFICTTFAQEIANRGDQFFRVVYRDKVSHIIPIDREAAINYLHPDPHI